MQIFKQIKASNTLSWEPRENDFWMHTHDDYEIYCFLFGDAKYAVEGSIYSLKPGDLILMRRSEAHHLLLQSSAPYRRMTVNFTPPAEENGVFSSKMMIPFVNRPLGRHNRYPAAVFGDFHWQYYLEKICDAKEERSRSIYLAALLEELSDQFGKMCSCEEEQVADQSADIIGYINRHLTEPLSLERISERFYLSKSQLNRKFKQANGSTVWEYITAKRLLMAKELLEHGGRPTEIYQQCGFGDYATFYRAYRRQFGITPKNDRVLTWKPANH
ncbi:MAG: AraC family transcriptional regulator [Fusicatenibacter sp.]|nr:AraC family transcriptional regulator [Fusicatenibacter sp.]